MSSEVQEQSADYNLADLKPVLENASGNSTLLDSLPIWLSAQTTKSAGRGRSADNTHQYGIQKLRELIIGLALRGQLTESQQKLQETIETDISKAKESYFSSKSKSVKKWEHSEVLIEEFVIPKGWLWKRIGMLCDLQTGATPSRNRPDFFGGEIKWLVSGDINQVRIKDCDGRITEEGLNNSNCKILPEGTVLIALNGQGKTRASTALLETQAACNQSLVGMIPFCSNLLDSRFLLLALQYRYFEIRDITGQKQRRGLNMKLVSDLSVPLAPISTQRQIVKKVDELMALCDKLERQQADAVQAHDTLVKVLLDTLTQSENADDFQQNWRRIAEHFDTLFTTESSIDQLKQTLLQLAVMGKLVPQDPNDEPASVLLEKIAKEKERLQKSEGMKTKASEELEGKDKYISSPESWAWIRIGNTSKFIDYRGRTPQKVESGRRLITAKNVRPGYIDIEPQEFITEDDYHSWMTRGFPRTGDILFTTEAPLGNVASIDIQENFALAQRVICMQWHIPEISSFMLIQMMAKPFQNQLIDNATGMTATGIKAAKLKEIPVVLPPLAEQHHIVKKVVELMALCDQLKERLNQSQILQQQLADAVASHSIT